MATDVTQLPKDSSTGVKFMIHDLAQPVSGNTSLIDSINVINIPQPILKYNGGDELMLYTKGSSDEWLKHQPMAFLFRYKKRKSKRDSGSAWVHPVDINGATRWAGSKFYNGERRDSNTNILPGIITELSIPSYYSGNVGIKFPFNRFMFWRSNNGIDVKPNGLDGVTSWHSFNCHSNFDKMNFGYITDDGQNFSDMDDVLTRKRKVQKFRIAFGIRNLNATPQNGKNPMIFGPMSDLILTMPGRRRSTDGKGSYMGINETARLAYKNSLNPVFAEVITNWSNSIYSNTQSANDIIVRIGASNTY